MFIEEGKDFIIKNGKKIFLRRSSLGARNQRRSNQRRSNQKVHALRRSRELGTGRNTLNMTSALEKKSKHTKSTKQSQYNRQNSIRHV